LVVVLEPMTPMAEPPRLSRTSLSLAGDQLAAASQVAGSSLPWALRMSGLVRRSALSTKSKPKRPLAQRKSPLMPLLSRLSARTISDAVVGLADAEGDFAAVAAVGADGGDVVHLPGTGLVAIGAAGERADRADVDAHAALLAVEVVAAVGGDDRGDAAVLHAERPDIHAFAAHADAAVAEDAAGAVEVDGRRPLLLFAVLLGFDVEAFAGAVLEGHVLQFALAAGIADRAVEGMIAEQQFDGGLAGLGDLGRLGDEDLALGDGGGAGGLQLGHFFLAHDAHAAGVNACRGGEAELRLP
jgi:hypothetical protein